MFTLSFLPLSPPFSHSLPLPPSLPPGYQDVSCPDLACPLWNLWNEEPIAPPHTHTISCLGWVLFFHSNESALRKQSFFSKNVKGGRGGQYEAARDPSGFYLGIPIPCWGLIVFLASLSSTPRPHILIAPSPFSQASSSEFLVLTDKYSISCSQENETYVIVSSVKLIVMYMVGTHETVIELN